MESVRPATSSSPFSRGWRAPRAALVVASCLVLGSTAPAAAETRILVADPDAGTKGRGALFTVDALGNRTMVSNFGLFLQGPLGVDPMYVAVQPGGLVLVLDKGAGTRGRGALFVVDADTGRRRIVSDFGKSAQGPLGSPPVFSSSSSPSTPATIGVNGVVGIALAADGRVLVGDATGDLPAAPYLRGPDCSPVSIVTGEANLLCGAIYAVEPDGSRSILRDYRSVAPGPSLLRALAADSDGSILVGFAHYFDDNDIFGYLGRVAPDGLAEAQLARFDDVEARTPLGLALEASGDLLAAMYGTTLYRIDPQLATPQVLTTFDSDPALRSTPFGVAVGSNGTIFVTQRPDARPYDTGPARLTTVDPVTGAFEVLSDFRNPAQGPTGVIPSGVALLPRSPKVGDILVVDYEGGTGGRGALFIVDPSTGDREIFSDFGNPAQGDLGRDPYAVAIDDRGRIWVADQRAGTDCTGFGGGCGGLFAVDPLSGMRKLHSDLGNGAQGPTGLRPMGVAIDLDGEVLVADEAAGPSFGGALFRVDPGTGARQVIATFAGRSTDVALRALGPRACPGPGCHDFLVPEIFPGARLSRIPADTGVPVPLTDFTDPLQGSPAGIVPRAVTVDAGGRILVVDQVARSASPSGYGLLYEVDPTTGSFTVVTDFTDETQGPFGYNPSDVVVEASGNVLVTDFDSGSDDASGAVFLVDRTTGNRTFLSDFADAAQGPTGVEPCGLAIFPGVGFPGVDVHDLALTKIVVPTAVKLTATKPSVVKNVKVQIQNRGTQPVVVGDAATLAKLVELDVVSLGACPAPVPSLVVPKKLPITVKSKQRLTLGYTLTFDCANDPAKNRKDDGGHDDFELGARVQHTALGAPDDHPVDDGCPRSVAPPFEVEPYPDTKIREKGCGETKPDGTLGAPVLLDVVVG